MLEGFTGYLLPWDQTRLLGEAVGINLNATALRRAVPGQFLQGGQIGGRHDRRFYSMHMLLIPGGIIALIGLHLYLVVRLGVTSPPWSRTRPAARGREANAARRP